MKGLALFALLRPLQWLKNLMLLFPPFLGGTLTAGEVVVRGAVPLLAFCLISSAQYVFNDLRDRETDALHPVKSKRPLTSGTVTVPEAMLLSAACLIGAVILGWGVSLVFLKFMGLYLAISTAYTLKFKEVPVADLFCIAGGFLVRLMAGGAVFGITVSAWLFLSVFFLSLFLSAGKRLSEQCRLGDAAGEHRKILSVYPHGFLEGTLFISGASVLVTYTMYVVAHQTLIATVVVCCFGLLRYIRRVLSGQCGDPTRSLVKDPSLFASGVIWVVLAWWGIYG